MASIVQMVMVFSCLVTCFAAFQPPDISERCQNSLHREYIKNAINSYLRKIPNQHNFLQNHPPIDFSVLTVNALNISGLGHLWLYQPPKAYCIAGNVVVETVLLAGQDLDLTLHFKTCYGRTIELHTSAKSSRLVAVFALTAPVSPLQLEAEPSLVRLLHVYPEDLQSVALHAYGVDEPIGHAVNIFGILVTPYLESLWRYTLRNSIQYIVEE